MQAPIIGRRSGLAATLYASKDDALYHRAICADCRAGASRLCDGRCVQLLHRLPPPSGTRNSRYSGPTPIAAVAGVSASHTASRDRGEDRASPSNASLPECQLTRPQRSKRAMSAGNVRPEVTLSCGEVLTMSARLPIAGHRNRDNKSHLSRPSREALTRPLHDGTIIRDRANRHRRSS